MSLLEQTESIRFVVNCVKCYSIYINASKDNAMFEIIKTEADSLMLQN